MSTIRSTYRYPCDLSKGTTEISLRTPLMQSDSEADEFRAQIMRNGVPISVSGMTVYGYLYNAMEQTTLLLDGTASGNEASVVLSSECYKHPGYASLAIQVVEGDVRHTVLKVNLCITRTSNDYVIDGENVIPTLPDLLGQIAAMEQATAAAKDVVDGVQGDLAVRLSLESDDASVIPDGTDFDTLMTSGNYKVETVSSGVTMGNAPTTLGGRLMVMNTSQNDRVVQMYIANTTGGRVFIRLYDGAWSAWDETAKASAVNALAITSMRLESGDVETIPNGTDFNTLMTPGNYKVETLSAGATMINAPTAKGGRLTVMSTSQDDRIVQTYIANANAYESYVRVYDGVWGDWKQEAAKSDLINKVDLTHNADAQQLPNGTDYDTLGVGQYYCPNMSAAQSMVNCPSVFGHRLLVMNTYSASDYFQIVIENRKIWYRYRGEAWKTPQEYTPMYPEYYDADGYMTERLNTIRRNIMNAGFRTDSFGIITDTHWGSNAKNSPGLLQHIALKSPVNQLMMLGDYYSTDLTLDNALRVLNDSVGSFKGIGYDLRIMVGNHDYNSSTLAGAPLLTEAQLYASLMTGQRDAVMAEDSCTFWVDNASQKIMYFFTNCTPESSYDPVSYHWIFKQMQDIPDGYYVMIFTHSGLSGSTSFSREYTQYLTGALAALKNKTTYTFDGVTYDYSKVNATPICVYAGHRHSDYMMTDGGIACLETTCDAYKLEEGGLVREIGTITEQAFDICTLDNTNHIIYLTRIGAGVDRINHYETISLAGSMTLSPKLEGTLTWSVQDASVVSVSGGKITRVGVGSSAVYATDADGRIEAWNVMTN